MAETFAWSAGLVLSGVLTLSYSSEGSPALAVFQTPLIQNCLKLTIPEFPYNGLPVSCGDIGFLK
jgi:hypothetical protein